MKKIISKMTGSIVLLFCIASVQAQYAVFKVKGNVEMSDDGKTWKAVKKKEPLKATYQIKLTENSAIDIIDAQNMIYSYTDAGTVTVEDIVKQRKSVFEALDENSGVRRAIGGVVRSDGRPETDFKDVSPRKGVYVLFTDMDTFTQYNCLDSIPAGTVFYMTICNITDTNVMANVYQHKKSKGKIKKMTPCFPKNIYIEKNTTVDITDVLFGKPKKNIFTVMAKDATSPQ